MKYHFNLHVFFEWMVIVTLLTGCGGQAATPAVQLTKSGWEAQRYLLFNKVWASITSLQQVDILNNTWKSVLLNGYVTTDATGQGKLRKGASSACTVYVFQSSHAGVTEEAISTCPKGSTSTSCTNASTWLLTNCGISAVTLPAKINFKGTAVTIIEYRDLEAVVVLSSEGVAVVTPNDQPDMPFEVNPTRAAYAVTPEFRQQAESFFGFPPGTEVNFDQFIAPIEQMNQVQQVQSANLVLRNQNLPIVPLPVPFMLGLRWLNEQPDNMRLSEAIAQSINWNSSMEQTFPGIPLLFETQGQRLDLRSFPYDPGNGAALLAESGYPAGQEMVIAFDESIPGLADLAFNMSNELTNNAGLAINVQPFNPDSAEGLFADLEARKIPVLILSGF